MSNVVIKAAAAGCFRICSYKLTPRVSIAHQSITERRLCVDYKTLIACPPHLNCLPESAKLSQYGAAQLLFAPRRAEKLGKQEGKAHTRNKWKVEVEMVAEGVGIAQPVNPLTMQA